jgi:hypothetical protein
MLILLLQRVNVLKAPSFCRIAFPWATGHAKKALIDVLKCTPSCIVDMEGREVVAACSSIHHILKSDAGKQRRIVDCELEALNDALVTLGKHCVERQGSLTFRV